MSKDLDFGIAESGSFQLGGTVFVRRMRSSRDICFVTLPLDRILLEINVFVNSSKKTLREKSEEYLIVIDKPLCLWYLL